MPNFKDLTGKVFGEWTVLYRNYDFEHQRELEHKPKKVYYKCRCSCGKEVNVVGANLVNSTSTNCGCKRIGHYRDLTGLKFGRLLVLEKDNFYRKQNNLKEASTYWKCLCDCGTIKTVCADSLINGKTKSCGCYNLECIHRPKPERRINIANQIFGFLIALEPLEETNADHGTIWKCQCQLCGNIVNVPYSYLVSGDTKSCGCLTRSYGEEKIRQILLNNNIPFEEQKSFETCRFPDTNWKGFFDFYVNNSFLLEYDGIQHYKANGFFSDEAGLKKQKERDKFKNEWCRNNHIPLKRIPYYDIKNITYKDIMGDKYLIY